MGYDKEDMMSVLEEFPEQCKKSYELGSRFKFKPKGKFSSIVVCGMGGSGIGGDLLKALVDDVAVYAVHGYSLPKHIDKKALVIIISYSGNTEETLECYNQAKRKKLEVLTITSGGKLAEKDKQALIVPSGIQPRSAIGYLFISMVAILSSAKIIPNQKKKINEAIRLINPKRCSRQGFLIAQKIKNSIPVFYGSRELEPVAYRIKTAVNENAKQPAYWHYFPEMNHNELNGFNKITSKIITVFLYDKNSDKKVKRRMEITKKMLKAKKVKTVELTVHGKSLLERMMYSIYIGDYLSYYLALMNKEDPTPVPIVEEFKTKLNKG